MQISEKISLICNSPVDLDNFRLFIAEYDEHGVPISVKSGAAQISDNVLTITSDLPLSDNYKLFLWDGNQTQVTDVITKRVN